MKLQRDRKRSKTNEYVDNVIAFDNLYFGLLVRNQ